ncbi:hypothetical protein MBLNU459_g0191t1 [Dothideomycetes sp. NU459]
MASHVYVVDASARRTQIKTGPATHLRTVLDEACAKMKLDPEHYALKNGNKQLDLSLTIRLSGLVSGAKLQLTQASRSPSVVSVALQLPESEKTPRLQDRFPSNTSLWLVLRKFEEGVAGGQKLNITQRGVPSTDSGPGRLCYEQPCMNAMGRELSSFLDLQKTLAQLGYNSGSVLFRVNFRNDGVPMEQAMAQISEYFGAVDGASQSQNDTSAETRPAHGAHANDDMNMTSMPDASAKNATVPDDVAGQSPSEDNITTPPPPSTSQPATQPPQTDDVIASSETAIPSTASQFPSLAQPADGPSEPSLSVYSAPTGPAPAAALQPHNEADFVPSVEHAKSHQATLGRAAANRRLQSDKELEDATASRTATLSAVKSVILRIRFPDQMMVDIPQGPDATVKHLYRTVRDMLADSTLNFGLRYPGDKGMQTPLEPRDSEKKLISGLGLTGRIMITFVWDPSVGHAAREKPVLKESLRGQAKQLEVKLQEQRNEDAKQGDGKNKDEETKEKRKAPTNKADVEAKLKRLMGFGKK